MSIYSWGYDNSTPDRLEELAETLAARVIDVRSVPNSRRPGFGRRQLEALLGVRYVWKGETLGGRAPGVTPQGLAYLRSLPPEENVILLCKEAAPGDCHRHFAIAKHKEVHLLRVIPTDKRE